MSEAVSDECPDEYPDEMLTVTESSPLLDSGLQEKHGTVFSSVFTLVSTMVGGGILSLPFAFQQGGFILTSVVLFIILMASTHGGFLIVNSKKYCQGRIKNVEDVGKIAYGNKGKVKWKRSIFFTPFRKFSADCPNSIPIFKTLFPSSKPLDVNWCYYY